MKVPALALALLVASTQAKNRAKITYLSPNGGPFDGGTFLTVTGKGFADYGDVKCRFGTMEVLAIVNSSTHIECSSPKTEVRTLMERNGERQKPALYPAKFEVSMNGVDYSRTEAVYNFYDTQRVHISLLTPNGGPATGDTAVTLKGTNFRDLGGGIHGPQCRFGNLEMVPATVDDFYTMRCVSPVRYPYGTSVGGAWRDKWHDEWKRIDSNEFLDHRDALPLEVTFNGYDTVGTLTESNATYTYYDPIDFNLTYVSPKLGPIAGGTLILVNGTHFHHFGGGKHGLLCGFGGNYVRASLLDYFHVMCNAPPLDAAELEDNQKEVQVTVTLNGDTRWHSITDDKYNYTYYNPHHVRITGLDTWGGPIAGDTMVVIHGVLGNPYIQIDEGLLEEYKHVRCRFGPARREPRARGQGVVDHFRDNRIGHHHDLLSSETWAVVYEHSVKALECRSPMHTISHKIGDKTYYKYRMPVQVDITLNGQDYTTIGRKFYYYPVHGHEATQACKQHWHANLGEVSDDPHWQDCLSDDERTNNQQELGLSVSNIQPQGGPFDGNTMVTVFGTHFMDFARTHYGLDHQGSTTGNTEGWQHSGVGQHASGLFCRFGGQHAGGHHFSIQMGTETPATLLDYHTMVCRSPYVEGAKNNVWQNEYIDVTLNGQNNSFTMSKVNFTYYGQHTVKVLSIYPEAGPKEGGTTVTITGTGFRDIGGVRCRFGNNTLVPATILNLTDYNGEVPGNPYLDNNHRPETWYSGDNADGDKEDTATVDGHTTARGTWHTQKSDYTGNTDFTEAEKTLGNMAAGEGSPPLQKLICRTPEHANTELFDPEEVVVRVTINNDPQHVTPETDILFTYF